MSKAPKTVTALSRIFSAARSEANATHAIVLLVKQAHNEKASLADIRTEYVAGILAAQLELTAPVARRLLILKGWKKGEAVADDQRNEKQEVAYGTARVYWARVMRAAGIAAAPAKSDANKGKTKASDETKSNAPVTVSAMVIPKTVNAVQVGQWMHLISASLTKFEAKNSGAFIGDDGAKYRDAIHAFVASVKNVHVEETPVTKVHMTRTSRGH